MEKLRKKAEIGHLCFGLSDVGSIREGGPDGGRGAGEGADCGGMRAPIDYI